MGHKVIICAGGTGGHLFPAQVLAKELVANNDVEVLFVGGALSKNAWFQRETFQSQDIPCASLNGKNPIQWLKSFFKIAQGFWASWQIFKSYQPDLIVAFGSYHTLPTLLAACATRQKFVLHEQNKRMGKVNRFFANQADLVMLSFPDTFPQTRSSCLVQMPLKFALPCEVDRSGLLTSLHLKPSIKTVLVCGGSQGAVSVNQYLLKALPYLKNFEFQVIHLTGYNDSIDDIVEAYQKANVLAYVKEFDPHIHRLMQVADFMISRAGASLIFELIALSLPSILIPYPFAGGHQEHNADFIQDVVQGGMKLPQSILSGELLAKAMISFFNDENIKEYRQHIRDYRNKTTLKSCFETVLQQLEGR